MVHSMLAVLAGFVVMALLVMMTTALAVRFVLHLPVSSMRTPGPGMPSPAYLATNVAASGIAALVGGYTTAAIAAHDQIAHGLGLAAVMVVIMALGWGVDRFIFSFLEHHIRAKRGMLL